MHTLPLQFWRSQDQKEVDFLIDERIAIEVKATKRLSKEDFDGINALKDEGLPLQYYIISQDEIHSAKNDVNCLHWEAFIERLWAGKIL